MRVSDTPIRDGFLEWGRSGSFYPLLKPAPESQNVLEGLQDQIQKQDATAHLTSGLHSTFFYTKPPKLYKRLLEIRPELDEAELYLCLTSTITTLLMCRRGYSARTEVEGIDRFGPNEEIVALKLADMVIREEARKLLRWNLNISGFGKRSLDKLAEDPAYQWVFGPSAMHISLADGVTILDPNSLALPDTIIFDTIGDGTVQAPGDDVKDRYRWYLGL